MDLQYIALQIMLHKNVSVQQAYKDAEEFLNYQAEYDKQKRRKAEDERVRAIYARARDRFIDCENRPDDVYLSITDPFS